MQQLTRIVPSNAIIEFTDLTNATPHEVSISLQVTLFKLETMLEASLIDKVLGNVSLSHPLLDHTIKTIIHDEDISFMCDPVMAIEEFTTLYTELLKTIFLSIYEDAIDLAQVIELDNGCPETIDVTIGREITKTSRGFIYYIMTLDVERYTKQLDESKNHPPTIEGIPL